MKIVGCIPGLTTSLGVSHQAIDDIALMRALPNMTIIEPSGPEQIGAAVRAITAYSGPVYLRLPMVFGDTGENLPLKSLDIGKGQILTEGNDVAILASGTMIAEALAARSLLANQGVSVTVANIHTVKPLDAELVDQLARTHRVLITAENHSIIGGLGAAVSERLALAPRPSWFGMVGLKDVFAEGGTSAYLMRKYEMDAAAIATKALSLYRMS